MNCEIEPWTEITFGCLQFLYSMIFELSVMMLDEYHPQVLKVGLLESAYSPSVEKHGPW